MYKTPGVHSGAYITFDGIWRQSTPAKTEDTFDMEIHTRCKVFR